MLYNMSSYNIKQQKSLKTFQPKVKKIMKGGSHDFENDLDDSEKLWKQMQSIKKGDHSTISVKYPNIFNNGEDFMTIKSQKVYDDGDGSNKVKERLMIPDRMNFEGFNKRNWNIIYNSFDPNVKTIFDNGMQITGVDKTVDMVMKQVTLWAPDVEITSHRIQFGSGDWTCTNLIIEGTFTKPMGDIQPTGKKFKMDNCVIYRWNNNDKITELYIFSDSLETMKQLGINRLGMTGGGLYEKRVYISSTRIQHGGNIMSNSDDNHLMILQRINFEGFNNRDWSIVSEGFDENIVTHLTNGTTIKGRDKNIDFMKMSLEWAPDSSVTAHKIQFGSGDWTCMNMITEGTFMRPMTTSDGTIIQPTGRRYLMSHCSLNKWNDNKIIESYVFYDVAVMMKQIGINKL